MVDQTTRGHQFILKNFGADAAPRATWQIDPFGHSNTQAASFNRVVLIEYPRKGLYALAFTTGPARGAMQSARPEKPLINCFVPTTPNPTSGLTIIVPRKDVIELDMEVDEALKMIISLGVVVPTWREDQTGELPLIMPEEPEK